MGSSRNQSCLVCVSAHRVWAYTDPTYTVLAIPFCPWLSMQNIILKGIFQIGHRNSEVECYGYIGDTSPSISWFPHGTWILGVHHDTPISTPATSHRGTLEPLVLRQREGHRPNLPQVPRLHDPQHLEAPSTSEMYKLTLTHTFSLTVSIIINI